MGIRAGKRGKKWIILTGAGILLAAGIGGICIIQPGKGKKGAAVPEAIGVKAGRDTLSTSVVGSGSLQGGEIQDIQVPSGLVIESVAVETGDTVSAGQVLATVNETALKAEIAQVQSVITQLDEQLQKKSGETQSENLTSKVAGRIKKIYVESGDSIADVMAAKGALMLLSLDGKMAVQIENGSGFTAGSTVSVSFSQGTVVSGTVETHSGDLWTVTVEDDGAVLGDDVTVSDSSGQVLGTGTLKIHQPLEVTGTSGTVSAVSVEENQWVEAGESLLTLEDVLMSAEYQKLLLTRAAYKERLQKLLILSEDCAVTALLDGTIESVEITKGSTTAASTGNSGGDETSSTSKSSSSIPASSMSYDGSNRKCTVKSLNGVKMADDSAGMLSGRESSSDGSGGKETNEGQEDQLQQEEKKSQSQQETSKGQPQQEEETNTQAHEDTENEGNARHEVNEESASETGFQQGGSQESNQEAAQIGTSVQSQSSLQPDSAAVQSVPQEDSASQTQTSAQEDSAAQEQEASQTDQDPSGQTTVDSHTEEVQEAQITLEALEDQLFTGVVTQVSDRTSGSEGSAKYTVEITVDKEESMRVGMSASAVIITDKKENVVTIPSDAVQEQGPRMFVYTQYDSEKGVLSGIQEVETGMSDGEKVEITSGLEEGDTVYCQRQESSSSDGESQSMPENGMFGGMGQDGGFGGEMPGGNMPGQGDGGAPGYGQGMPGGGSGRTQE
ncbi:MAG: biotin/lipoyl-binding protein [Lachnospiraceae bacterium]|nr:biotin/lipoyl-binding protein [Lachnospiraceae bacterium]